MNPLPNSLPLSRERRSRRPGYSVISVAPPLEMKTALKENPIGLRFNGRAWIADAWASDDDRTEKIYALDSGEA